MDIDDFAHVVTYTLTPDRAPTPTIIAAVRAYNQRRVEIAKHLQSKLSDDIVSLLRKADAVDVIDSVPKHAKCAVSKQYIQNGITLLLKPGDRLVTVSNTFREPLRRLFLVFHFDDEIRKAYHNWAGRAVRPAIDDFVRYNQSSHIKQLFVVFQQVTSN